MYSVDFVFVKMRRFPEQGDYAAAEQGRKAPGESMASHCHSSVDLVCISAHAINLSLASRALVHFSTLAVIGV